MQITNSTASLYQIPHTNVRDGGHGYSVEVEIYDTVGKVNKIRAYTFHPNQKTICSWIINFIVELWWGKTALQIKVAGEPSALYMRVHELSEILNISAETIQKAAKKGDITDFVIENQKNQTLNTVEALAKKRASFIWNEEKKRKIEQLMKQVGYRSLLQAIQCQTAVSDSKMVSTLCSIAEALDSNLNLNTMQSEVCYEYAILLPDIYITVTENLKRTKINLKNLEIRVEDLLAATLVEMQQLAKQQGINWRPSEKDRLEKVIKQIDYKNALALIKHSLFDPTMMLRTLFEVGYQLIHRSPSYPKPQNIYEIEIRLPTILVSKQEKDKVITINLHNMLITTTPKRKFVLQTSTLAPPTSSQASQAPQPTSSKKETKPITKKMSVVTNLISTLLKKSPPQKEAEEFNLAAQNMGIRVESDQMKSLDNLAERTTYSNLLSIVAKLDSQKKIMMMNTFIEIGRKLSLPALFDGLLSRLVYVKKIKDPEKLAHAFAISKRNIFIVQEKLARGSFKVISAAFQTNNLNRPQVRVKLLPFEGKPSDLAQRRMEVAEMKKEAALIKLLHKKNKKNQGCRYIVLPFDCEIKHSNGSKKNIIYFHFRYHGDGTLLIGQPLIQRVNALRGVALGLDYVHNLGYVHMDVKPPNLLIEGDPNVPNNLVEGRISDFGTTVKKGNGIKGGSPLYLPKETMISLNKEVYINTSCPADPKIDSFSFGITILELIDQRPTKMLGLVYQTELDLVIKESRSRIEKSNTSQNDKALSSKVLDIVKDLLKVAPYERISCGEAGKKLEILVPSV